MVFGSYFGLYGIGRGSNSGINLTMTEKLSMVTKNVKFVVVVVTNNYKIIGKSCECDMNVYGRDGSATKYFL